MSEKSGSSNDNGRSNEGKCSAIRFTKDTTGVDNTLKQRIRVDVIYTVFVADTSVEVSIVTETTSRFMSFLVEKSDQILSGANVSLLLF